MPSAAASVPGRNPLGYEKIPVLLRRYAIPSIIAMVVSSLYNIVDQIFIGQGVGYLGNAATNVAYPLTTICLSIALLIGAVYMIVRKVISPRIPLIYIGTVAVFVFIFGGFDVNYTINQIFAGGLIFGAFFMATDYVTSPITAKGQILYGVFLGILTGVFRLWGGSPEGVSYAIILGNVVVPLIEKVTYPKAFGKEGK